MPPVTSFVLANFSFERLIQLRLLRFLGAWHEKLKLLYRDAEGGEDAKDGDVRLLTNVQKLSSPSRCFPGARHPGIVTTSSLYRRRT